ncbi:MAG: hypothetical protein KAH57_10620 [Thermoplasmata archaeon]|nr:hypothetical protein [Thermoplasmata archaeon]
MYRIANLDRMLVIMSILSIIGLSSIFSIDSEAVAGDGIPMLIKDHTLKTAYAGEPFKFIAELFDEDGVDQAMVEYWFEPEVIENRSMVNSGDNWTWSIVTPHTSNNLNYEFHFRDINGAWNETMWRSIQVIDAIPPVLDDDLTPDTASTGDEFTFSIEASDNVGLQAVFLEYWFGEGDRTNISMTGGDDYSFTLDIPVDSLETLYYFVGAIDTSALVYISDTSEVTITDDDPPTITGDLSIPGIVSCGDNCTISAVIKDNINLTEVKMEYWFTGGAKQEIVMEKTGTLFTCMVKITQDCTADLELQVIGTDSSGNVFRSSTEYVEIEDRTPPVIEPISDVYVNVSELFTITVVASDNVRIDSVEWSDSPIGSDDLTLSGSVAEEGVYLITVTITDDAGNYETATFSLYVRALEANDDPKEDSSGGAIFIAVIVVFLVIAVIGVVGFLIYKNKKDNEVPQEEEKKEEEEPFKKEKPEYENFSDVPMSVGEAHTAEHLEHKDLSYDDLYGANKSKQDNEPGQEPNVQQTPEGDQKQAQTEPEPATTPPQDTAEGEPQKAAVPPPQPNETEGAQAPTTDTK